MINLGDVNFSLGADTDRLRASADALERFGKTVERAQSMSGKGAAKVAADLRKQERAAVNAFNRVQNLTNSFRAFDNADSHINNANRVLERYNRTLVSSRLSALEFQRANQQFSSSLGVIQRHFKNAQGTAGGLAGQMERLTQTSILVAGPLSGVASRVATMTAVMKAGGAEAAAFIGGLAAGVWTIQQLGMAILDAGRQMDSFMSRYQAVTGSFHEGMKELQASVAIARDAGTLITSTAPAFAKFAASTEGTILQGETTRQMFEDVAKTASILQLNTEQTTGAFRALEQIMSKGKVQAEELRGQLGERIPGAFQIAARAMGVTSAKLSKMMEDGEVMASEFLPKFTAELRKTFNIPSGPIDNFTASLNNMHNAFFQLMAAMDAMYGVSAKVKVIMDQITASLDWLRENLREVTAVALLAGGALAGLATPVILGGIATLIVRMGKLAASINLVNIALMATPYGRLGAAIIKLGFAIAGAAVAVGQFGDSITVIDGQLGTLRDYIDVIWSDIMTSTEGFRNWISGIWAGMQDIWRTDISGAGDIIKTFFGFVNEVAARSLNAFANTIVKTFNALKAIWPVLPEAIADGVISALNWMIDTAEAGMNKLLSLVNKGITKINGVIEFFGGEGFSADWHIDVGNIANEYAGAGKRAAEEFAKAYRSQESVDYYGMMHTEGEKAIQDVKDYFDTVRERSNELARDRQRQEAMASRWDKMAAYYAEKDRQELLAENLANAGTGLDEDDGKGSKGARAAQRRLERKLDAMEDINREIDRTRQEIEALGGTERGLEMLTEKFKREDQVRRFGDAMRKAGVDTAFIAEKTRILNDLLKEKAALERYREGLVEIRDALSGAFDSIGSAISNVAFSGEDALESMRDVGLKVAQDLWNAFYQLAVTNPLKNAFLGMNEPTIGGGFLKGLGGLLGSFWGGGGVDPWAGLRGHAGFAFDGPTKYLRKGGLTTGPTYFSTPNGGAIGGEAGTEALMPLKRNSSGQLGVTAEGLNRGSTVVNVYAPQGTRVKKKQRKEGSLEIIDIMIQEAIDDFDKRLPDRVAEINSDPRARKG